MIAAIRCAKLGKSALKLITLKSPDRAHSAASGGLVRGVERETDHHKVWYWCPSWWRGIGVEELLATGAPICRR